MSRGARGGDRGDDRGGAGHVSFAVKVRRFLDAPLARRPPWWWPASPFLFLCSFVVAIVALSRRVRDDRKRRADLLLATREANHVPGSRARAPLLVCIGNVLVGGSGKSPIVRAFAESLLSRGETVIVASRGYGRKETLVLPAAALTPSDLALLSDEMREHFELLRLSCGDAAMGRLFLAQGADRRANLARVSALLAAEGVDPGEAVALLDDGLQHFRVRPDVRVCVWKEDLFDRAPRAALPLGPYREGFFFGFTRFLSRFEAHVWSRLPEGEMPHHAAAAFRARVAGRERAAAAAAAGGARGSALPRAAGGGRGTPPHLVALARQVWLLPAAAPEAAAVAALAAALRGGRVAVACGLGQPDAFVRAALAAVRALCTFPVHEASPSVPLFLLPDHGVPSRGLLETLSSYEHLVLSAKDWFRTEALLAPALASRRGHPWVLCVKVRLEDPRENTVDPASLLAPFRARGVQPT